MKIRFLKEHGFNAKGFETEAPDAAANYLIRVGAAEEIKEVVHFEKEYVAPVKEKKENKTGNVPTAKKRKINKV